MSETLLNIRTNVRARLDETTAKFWTDAQLNVWINQAASNIAKRSETLLAKRTIPIITNSATYAAPADTVRLHRLEFSPDNGQTLYPLEPREYGEMDQIWGCVDQETELLSWDGWTTHDRLKPGDLILTFNERTGFSEWLPIERVNRYEVTDEPLVRMEGKLHSSLTTSNHRWLLKSRRVGHRWEWRISEQLRPEEYVPRAAPCIELPTVPKYSDALVEIVAWFWTEGSIDSPTPRGYISQSPSVHPENCDRIRAALTAMGIKWRENNPPQSFGGIQFWIKRRDLAPVLEVAPGKIPTMDFIRSLTLAQLRLFIEVSMLGDGSLHSRDGTWSIAIQTHKEALERMSVACVLAGEPINMINQKDGTKRLSVLARSHLGKLPKRTEQRYTGTVWCPTTTNGSFFARRRGSVYVTGNSRQATSYAYPNFFVPWGFPPNLTMQLYPVPSASGILNIYYYRLPAPITGTSADATVVEVVQGYEPLIEDYAEYMALRKDADPRWQEAKQIYEETLGAMIDGTRRFHDGVGWFSYGTNILPQWLVGAGGGGWD